jgi:hypothetical protein
MASGEMIKHFQSILEKIMFVLLNYSKGRSEPHDRFRAEASANPQH